jgi:hypothetical protein
MLEVLLAYKIANLIYICSLGELNRFLYVILYYFYPKELLEVISSYI